MNYDNYPDMYADQGYNYAWDTGMGLGMGMGSGMGMQSGGDIGSGKKKRHGHQLAYLIIQPLQIYPDSLLNEQMFLHHIENPPIQHNFLVSEFVHC
jgi:hypothetical protein